MDLHGTCFCAPLRCDFAAAAHRQYSRPNRRRMHLSIGTGRTNARRRPVFSLVFLLFSGGLPLTLSGCLGGQLIGPSTTANTSGSRSLQAAPNQVSFGGIAVGETASSNLALVNQGSAAVQISQLAVSGQEFTVSGGGDLPLTVPAGGSFNLSVNFIPSQTGAANGQLTITSNATTNARLVVGLSGTGTAAGTTTTASLSTFACANGSMTAAGTDNCTVTLNTAAPSSGYAVSVTSNNSAVTVPASVIVGSGSTNVSFAARVSSVSSSETVTLTASAGGVAKTFALQLGAAVPILSVNSSSVTFGDVTLNTPTTQSLTLTSTGSAAVTISGATLSGSGFTASGATYPVTLNPNQSAAINIVFDPTAVGAATGQLTLVSNSSTGTSTLISLSGAGVVGSGTSPTYAVDLSWNAPSSSPDAIAGYVVLRSPSGASSYVQLDASAVTQTTYTDTTVLNGQSYDYIVESVDASGVASAPSNTTTAQIP